MRYHQPTFSSHKSSVALGKKDVMAINFAIPITPEPTQCGDDNNPLEARRQSLLRKGLSIETIDQLVHGCNTSPLPITFELKAYEILDECAELYDQQHQNQSESRLQALKEAYRTSLQNVNAACGKDIKSAVYEYYLSLGDHLSLQEDLKWFKAIGEPSHESFGILLCSVIPGLLKENKRLRDELTKRPQGVRRNKQRVTASGEVSSQKTSTGTRRSKRIAAQHQRSMSGRGYNFV